MLDMLAKTLRNDRGLHITERQCGSRNVEKFYEKITHKRTKSPQNKVHFFSFTGGKAAHSVASSRTQPRKTNAPSENQAVKKGVERDEIDILSSF